MEINRILKEKKEKKLQIVRKYWLLQKNKCLWLVKLTDKNLIKNLRDWFLALPTWIILEIPWVKNEKIWKNIIATSQIEENDLIWFDFIISDQWIEYLNKYLEKWITPIINNNSGVSAIFQEFNPVKNTWNAYIYDDLNKWSIFYSLVKYLENFKFPYDNKNLVNNILKN